MTPKKAAPARLAAGGRREHGGEAEHSERSTPRVIVAAEESTYADGTRTRWWRVVVTRDEREWTIAPLASRAHAEDAAAALRDLLEACA